jgi:hypothetical protein
MKFRTRTPGFILLVLLLLGGSLRTNADPYLFIGNSYTMATGNDQAKKLGVGKMVEAIAKAKGKNCDATTLATGGKDFAFHLAEPKTAESLASQKWKAVILQNHSVSTLSASKLESHLKNAGDLARLIQTQSPGSEIILFQTWARAEGSSLYQENGSLNPSVMTDKSREGYALARDEIKKIFPDLPVRIAPVGEAFALSLKNHPGIKLHSADLHHASAEGSYLAALVIYATLYQDDPMGATSEFPGLAVESSIAASLQQTAREIYQLQSGTKQ